MKIVNGWIDEALDGHYGAKSNSREGHKPKYLVMHGTAGGSSAQGIDDFFTNGVEQASAHVIIDQQGVVIQGISLDEAAWANCCLTGNYASYLDASINQNLYTISIEHVKSSTDNSNDLTPIQAQKSFEVAQCICSAYGIPMRAGDGSGGIIGHSDIDPVNRSRCPGPYPWDQLWTFLQGGVAPVQQPIKVNKFIEQAAVDEWNSFYKAMGKTPPPTGLGIYNSWFQYLINGRHIGPPITEEYESVDWNGNKIVVQQFADGRCEWDGSPHWYSTNGGF